MNGIGLREWRKQTGASQAEIAQRAGVSRATIIALEKRERVPMLDILDAYGLGVAPIIGGYHAKIQELRRHIKECILYELGLDCEVNIEIKVLDDMPKRNGGVYDGA